MTTVLVVDDDAAIRRALELNLAQRGYDVIAADSGEAAMRAASDTRPDVVLLDLGLPGIDGQGVIAALRGWTTVPIIVLSARGEERSKVEALDNGADDYLAKPFGMGELLARLRAVLRRVGDGLTDESVVSTPDFRLDLGAHRATKAGVDVRLTPIEWAIVAFLVRHRGRLVTHAQLRTAVWGADIESDPTLLRVHLGHIRRKLEPIPSRPRYFITDSGVGYRFDPPQEEST